MRSVRIRRTTWLLLLIVAAACSAAEEESAGLALIEEEQAMTVAVSSSAFSQGTSIPTRYTCDGQDISPPLDWRGLPDGSVSLALIVEDPDAPGGNWVHWLAFNIPASTTGLPEGLPVAGPIPGGGIQGNNSWRRTGYGGPCPPSGMHRYFFKLYALDSALTLEPGITKLQLERAMAGHVLAWGQLMGTFSRG